MKTWLITGSSNGLGRSILEAALEGGDRVVATARNVGRLAALTQRFGDRIKLFELDVDDGEAAIDAVAAAVETFGGLDILVNNAGYAHIAPFEQKSAANFRAEIETNFFGVINLTRAAVPIMRRQRSGVILNISSVSGRFGSPGASAYNAAKFAVGGFTEAIAKELAPLGVRVVSIEPGSIRTNWGEVARNANTPRLLPDYQASVGMILEAAQAHSGNELGDPAEYARVIFDLSRRDDLPEHLVLGSDAVSMLAMFDKVRSDAAEAWKAISQSTDFKSPEQP